MERRFAVFSGWGRWAKNMVQKQTQRKRRRKKAHWTPTKTRVNIALHLQFLQLTLEILSRTEVFTQFIDLNLSNTETTVLDFWDSRSEWAALFALGRGICITHSLKFACGATPADLLAARHWWGSNGRPIVPQTNALPTELCRLGL